MRWVKASERLPGLKDELTLDCDRSVIVRRFFGDQKEIHVVEIGQVEEDDEWLENALEGMTKQ
jgi:hypothetical protein